MRSVNIWKLTALALTGGCAFYTSSIQPDTAADPRVAYLYGRFFIRAEADEQGFGGKQSVGFDIRCENGSSYTFGSRDKPDVQVLEVKPSRCWVTQVIVADQYRFIRKPRLPRNWRQTRRLPDPSSAPGMAHSSSADLISGIQRPVMPRSA